jgi:polyribonucleotide 5'-hydroxyl-kinase
MEQQRDTHNEQRDSILKTIQQERQDASHNQQQQGPRIMLAGPTDAGKSYFCRYMIQHSSTSKVFFVDVDVGQNDLNIPGTMSCAIYKQQEEEPFDINKPLKLYSFYFGGASPGDGVRYYNSLVDQIRNTMKTECDNDPELQASGFIVNTCGWTEKLGYKILQHVIRSLNINHVIAINDEKLVKNLQKDFEELDVISLNRHPNVKVRSKNERANARAQKVTQYFANKASQTHVIPFSELQLYQITQGTTIQKVVCGVLLCHSILIFNTILYRMSIQI